MIENNLARIACLRTPKEVHNDVTDKQLAKLEQGLKYEAQVQKTQKYLLEAAGGNNVAGQQSAHSLMDLFSKKNLDIDRQITPVQMQRVLRRGTRSQKRLLGGLLGYQEALAFTLQQSVFLAWVKLVEDKKFRMLKTNEELLVEASSNCRVRDCPVVFVESSHQIIMMRGVERTKAAQTNLIIFLTTFRQVIVTTVKSLCPPVLQG